jgi:hypothetical protein
VILAALSNRSSGQPLCGAHANFYNGRVHSGHNYKAASCIITTYLNTKLCNGGASEPASPVWVNITTAENPDGATAWVQVGYYRATRQVGGLNIDTTSYFYEIHLPGMCQRDNYVVATPAAGAQAYTVTRVGNIWRVTYAGNTQDSPADCATCDGLWVQFSAETHQPETCCVGDRANPVAFTNCQVDFGNGQEDPTGWVENRGNRFFPPGTPAFAQPAASVTADSFEIYDARN